MSPSGRLTMASDEPGHMWRYHSDRYGVKVALEDYFPKTLARNTKLQAAVAQIEMAEALIEKIMKEKEEAEDDDEG